MYWRSAAWFLAGFCVAITLVVEVGTPATFVVFACGFITRGLGALAIRAMYGSSLTELWHKYRPEQLRFWKHTWAYIKGEHPEHDPLICNHCNLA